jgi:hypothetical protein
MMTRDLALGMMRQADTGEQMLTVADAIVGLSEDLNIADAAAHFEQLQEQEAELDEVEVENDPMDDFNYVGSPHHY